MFKIISILAVLSLITNIAYANVSTAFEYKSRTFYSELENDPFQFSSRFKTNIHFPNIKRSFNIDPQLESIHYFNHSDASTKSISRLSQAYVNFSVPNYKISIGEKRINLQGKKVINDNNFSSSPQTFRQASLSANDDSWQLIYVSGYTPSNTSQSVLYEKGSIFASMKLPLLTDFNSKIYAYLIEDHSNTYSIDSTYLIDAFQSLSITYSHQDDPIINTKSFSDSSSFYYDAIYSLSVDSNQLNIGLRTFGNPDDSSDTGFAAPFSSGHSWDGYLNVYLNNVKNGFEDGQRIYFGSYKTSLSDSRKLKLSAYLFRGLSSEQDLGSEIDVSLSDKMYGDEMTWSYITGYFFDGKDSSEESEYKMWLDINVNL